MAGVVEKMMTYSKTIDMANAAPGASFTIMGDESNQGYLMAFEITFKNKELLSK